MKHESRGWSARFVRWLFGGPFQKLPPQYGNTVPPELQRFEVEADEAGRRGLGGVTAQMPSHHATTRPARVDEALERQ